MSDKILVIGPSWVGDMMMAQSLFKVLKNIYASCQIDVLAPSWSQALTGRMPEIGVSHTMPVGHGKLGLISRYRLGVKLSKQGYTQAYVLPNSFKSALVPFWAKIPKRIGWLGEWRYKVLNNVRKLDKKRYPLMVQRFVALVSDKVQFPNDIPFPKLSVDSSQISKVLEGYGLTCKQPVIAMCPGAEFGPSKRWPDKYYAQVANAYLAKGWQVWLFGSKKDAKVTTLIQSSTTGRCIDLAGKTVLGDAIDLLSCASLVLTNDSGLMHIAAALGRPLVAVYGSTDPKFTPPLGDEVSIVKLSDLPCSPCFKRECPLAHHHCMEKLTANLVLDHLEELESETTNNKVIFAG